MKLIFLVSALSIALLIAGCSSYIYDVAEILTLNVNPTNDIISVVINNKEALQYYTLEIREVYAITKDGVKLKMTLGSNYVTSSGSKFDFWIKDYGTAIHPVPNPEVKYFLHFVLKRSGGGSRDEWWSWNSNNYATKI